MDNKMISQSIELENLKKQLEEVNKDIESIQNDIKESESFINLREQHLEKKKNLKTSIEKRIESLKFGESSYSSFLDNESVQKRDISFASNQEQINQNNEKISQYNEQLKDTKSFFKKADITLQRKKVEFESKILNKKNVRIERSQRMYIASARKIEELKNKPLNGKVSINNMKLTKMQQKYQEGIIRTHELEEYKNELQNQGHKVRSKILGKVVEFYNKKDDRVRGKFQKLLSTKSELLKIESARQFYESYDLTRNQQKVLQGDKLTHEDITDMILFNGPEGTFYKDSNGDLYIKSSSGEVFPISQEMWEEVAKNHGLVDTPETKKDKVA